MKHRGQRKYLTYALNMDDELVHIDSVPNGNDCACFCPHCKSELCAKNGGEYKVHHFAHMHGVDCAGALESALHLMAKEVLQEIKSVRLPAMQNVYDAKEQLFDKVEIEFYDKDTSLRPDCIGYYGDKTIWIEFKRTHAVDKKKKGKIISARIDCIEIDLNGCELEPNKMRDFLMSQSDKRIWIYNSEYLYSDSKKSTNFDKGISLYEDYHYDEDWDDCHAHCVERTFAIDDNNRIVQSSRLEEIDMNHHSYFCIGCGKEVCIDANLDGSYCFVHIEDNTECSDGNYLIEAAKAILYDNFVTSEKFEVAIPQSYVCSSYADCKLYIEDECNLRKPKIFDLKSLGYHCCEKDVKLHNYNSNIDLCISKLGSDNSAIGVIVKSDDDGYKETIPLRLMEIIVRNEYDLHCLRRNNLKEYHQYKIANFKSNLHFSSDNPSIVRKIPTFILYGSGKSCVINTVCKRKSSLHPSTVKELYLLHLDMDDCSYRVANALGLLYCYRRQMRACYCRLCFFLKDTMGNESICVRYKTKGTPHYPLEEVPINCPYFSLNRELVSYVDEEYNYVKILE